MSVESWVKEFYPERACATRREEAAAHSLQKWIGFRKENLVRHGLETPPVSMFSSTCALCYHFDRGGEDDHMCNRCPLAVVRGIPCIDRRPDEVCGPFTDYTMHNNPEPMIHWLQKTVEQYERILNEQDTEGECDE